MKQGVNIKELGEQEVYGLWKASSDRAIAKDIGPLSAQFRKVLGVEKGPVLPYFVLNKGYDKATGNFDLFVGSVAPAEGLYAFTLPAGIYGQVTVRPVLGLFWGPALGKAKRDFYTRWLPGSAYRPRNMEFEHHTEKSVGKRPSIELFFAIEKK